MSEPNFFPPTKRGHMSTTRAARIFLAWNGRCGWCGLQIRSGERYEIDHPTALNLAGSDDDDKLQPIHVRCHKLKTKDDKAAIAKRNRIVTQGWAGKPKSKLSKEYRREVMRRYVRTGEGR